MKGELKKEVRNVVKYIAAYFENVDWKKWKKEWNGVAWELPRTRPKEEEAAETVEESGTGPEAGCGGVDDGPESMRERTRVLAARVKLQLLEDAVNNQ